MKPSNQLPIKVVIMLIDEVFDLKEKNQWIRQSLMAIVKSLMKSFKGDSVNRKIKEHIADVVSDEQVARYLKNYRKRMWPKGLLADEAQARSPATQQLTKLLAKTKLLALVSDEMRHLLGNDTSRRGLFNLFELFQHKQLNKRLLVLLVENLLVNLFHTTTPSAATAATNSPPPSSLGGGGGVPVNSASGKNASTIIAHSASTNNIAASGHRLVQHSQSSTFSIVGGKTQGTPPPPPSHLTSQQSQAASSLTSSPSLTGSFHTQVATPSTPSTLSIQSSPLSNRLHLSRSSRVKAEWRLNQHRRRLSLFKQPLDTGDSSGAHDNRTPTHLLLRLFDSSRPVGGPSEHQSQEQQDTDEKKKNNQSTPSSTSPSPPYHQQQQQQTPVAVSSTPITDSLQTPTGQADTASVNLKIRHKTTTPLASSPSSTSTSNKIPRSKSLFQEIQC